MAKPGETTKFKDPKSGTIWANEHTFQIANWMLNDISTFQNMRKFMRSFSGPIPYRSWIKESNLLDGCTPNGWKLMGEDVHYGELSEIMRASLY